MRILAIVFTAISLSFSTAQGQGFTSGSTGADGVLDLTSGDKTVVLPPSGILNYTTVNIPSGRVLSFQNNVVNSPVILLASGAVNVSGSINLSAHGRMPGPGGFAGGNPGQPGFGPGATAPPSGGSCIGPLSLVPNIGGSGASGYSGPWNCYDGGVQPPGGGGGGAITIAVTGALTVSGAIISSGSIASGSCNASPVQGYRGADGALRLVANSINVTGQLYATVVRLEAPLGSVIYAGNGTTPVVATINPTIAPTNSPSLVISSIAGFPVPSYSGTSFSTIDLLLPAQLQDPLSVVVQATNIPVGATVSVAFSGAGQSTSGTLAGTLASSTATLSISGLARSGMTYLFASSVFNLPQTAAIFNLEGPDRIEKVRLDAALGKAPSVAFLRSDGTIIEASKIPEPLLRQFTR